MNELLLSVLRQFIIVFVFIFCSLCACTRSWICVEYVWAASAAALLLLCLWHLTLIFILSTASSLERDNKKLWAAIKNTKKLEDHNMSIRFFQTFQLSGYCFFAEWIEWVVKGGINFFLRSLDGVWIKLLSLRLISLNLRHQSKI